MPTERRLLVVRAPLALAVAALAFAAWPALAAHPLQTEDTGTQGAGNVEIENGLSRARFDGTTATTCQPQVSVGLATTVDAIVQPSVVWVHAPGRPAVAGSGDTNVDAKWRFLGSDPWSFAIRAGVLAPTGQKGLGMPHGDVSEHALLVATWDATPTIVHANIGLAHAPRSPGTRANVAHLSTAVLQQVDERLSVTMDGELDQDADRSRKAWPGSVLAGAIWTARPGLDLDVGYLRSVNARPLERQWMAGLTWRFAL